MVRTWPALDVRSVPEFFEAALTDYDVTAINEGEDAWRIFFHTAQERDRAAAGLRAAFDALAIEPVDVPDEDWAARSQASLRSIQVGRVIVAPPWDAPVTIVVQPSMGFGTGHHASTRRCLALLQRVPVEGARVLDAGTGSGVLAIAAWKLGAREVVAADSDIDALTAARENLVRNRATDAIHLGWIDLAELPAAARPGASFDLVLANLTGGALIRFASLLAAQLGPAGRVIASGFQEGEVAPVAEAFARAGLTETDRDVEDGWVGATFRQES